MENNKMIQEYLNEVKNDFVKNYLEQLDENVLKMLNAFGYKEDSTDNIGQWLDQEGYSLLIDEDKKDNGNIKTIFLEDKKMKFVVALFMVEIMTDETGDIKFRFSDVFINRDFLDE